MALTTNYSVTFSNDFRGQLSSTAGQEFCRFTSAAGAALPLVALERMGHS